MQIENPYEPPQVSNQVPIAEESNISWADLIERRFRIVFILAGIVSILISLLLLA